jgi:ParB-like chromosome segregation protein Spo0J
MSNLFVTSLLDRVSKCLKELESFTIDDRVTAINAIRLMLHDLSPFNSEPVDCVQWVKSGEVQANDYNPNVVAPPEMRLLEHSITADGYTQPIVTWRLEDGAAGANSYVFEVVDGFHRDRVARECFSIRQRLHGYLPITVINRDREDRSDRIAATIRHNRARGKHQVSAMSDIVVELKRRNWSDERIGRELGMDPDEVLRLCQISGLAEMFADRAFSEAWEHTGAVVSEEEVAPEDSDSTTDLEWMKDFVKNPRNPGWHDRTDNSSVLYGDSGNHLAMIQRSRFKEEWFIYIYLQPIQETRAPNRDKAKEIVTEILAANMDLL